MENATLRTQIARLLDIPAHVRERFSPPAPPEPPLPHFAPQLFKLAYIAVGDADSAAVLTADVLALDPPDEIAALRLLVARLPEGWLSWPGAAGPSEWLRLHLRREQADRLLSVLGEWGAVERIAIALYVLWDVRRDELDDMLGTNDVDDLVSEFIGYSGEGLDLVTPGGDQPECADVAADLLEAHEPQVGRLVRLHTLGCETCRTRVHGLRRMVSLLRDALNIFFRVPPPANLAQLVALSRQQQRQLPRLYVQRYWQPALIVCVLAALFISLTHTPEPGVAAAPPPLDNAATIIDRALRRFEQPRLTTGILRERFQAGSGDSALLIERWYDYASPHRMRVTVRKPQQAVPLFDLATDGKSKIAYEVNDESRSQNALIEDREVAMVLPLVRQLPFAGGFSSLPVDQRNLDITLLAQARRARPTLLGTTDWRGREAYMISSVTPDVGRTILTIDRDTLSLLEARTISVESGAGTSHRVWQAEQVEVLPNRDVGWSTFDLGPRRVTQSLLNPRQLTLYPMSNLDINSAVMSMLLPMPTHLPDAPVVAYMRRTSALNASVLQIYEGQWSTVAVITPRNIFAPPQPELLERRFAHGRYRFFDDVIPQASSVEFVLDSEPTRHMALYFWHALLNDDERHAMIEQILDSLVLVDPLNVSAFSDRFVRPPAGSGVASPQRRAGGANRLVNRSASVQQRYRRAKMNQASRAESVRSDELRVFTRLNE